MASSAAAAAVGRLQTRVAVAAAEFEAEVARLPAQCGDGSGSSKPRREEKRKLLHDKEFVQRESLLSAMLSSGDESYRAIYHAMIATLIWLGVKQVLQDYSRRDMLIDFGLLTWAFDRTDVVLRTWLTLWGISFLVVPLVQYVAKSREPVAALRLTAVVYGAAQVGLYAVGMSACLTHALPPASGLIVMCETARMSMKMHAYVREKVVHGLRTRLAGIMPPEVLAAVPTVPATASPSSSSAIGAGTPARVSPASGGGGRAPSGGEEVVGSGGATTPWVPTPVRTPVRTPPPGVDALLSRLNAGDSTAPTPLAPPTPAGVVPVSPATVPPADGAGEPVAFVSPARSPARSPAAVAAAGAIVPAPADDAAGALVGGGDGSGGGGDAGGDEGADGEEWQRGGVAAVQPPSAATIALFRTLTAFADYLPPSAGKYGVTLASLRASRATITVGDANEEIGRFVYFFFAPTLVYRDAYPRSAGPINWVRAGTHTANLAGVVLYTYVITRSLLVPLLEPVPPKNPIDLVLLIQGAMVPAILVFLLTFFGVLHSWLNVWAELLRFSDRQFYTSWWTASSWSAYYRRWNLVVGDFLHSYVYNDVQRAGGSRQSAEAAVFLISAAIHEVIIACAYRFWYPALLAMFGGPGVLFMNLTRRFAARFANVFLWLMLSVGLGLLTVMYSRELYARYGYEWQGQPGVPATPPYVFNPTLHPSPGWGPLDWLSYVLIPRSWLEFWYTYYM